MYLSATVAYTDPPLVTAHHSAIEPPVADQNASGTNDSTGSRRTKVQIRVDSKVRNIEHGETKPTGQFNYTFLVDKDIKVMPRTYSEFMIWVDARRRAEKASLSIQGLEEDDGNPQARDDDGKKEGVTE